MATPTIAEVIIAIQGEAEDAGVRFTPDYTPDSPPTGTVATTWLESADWEILGTECGLVGGVVATVILTPRKDLARDLATLYPFLVSFPAQVHANPTLSDDQDIIRSVSARFIVEDWAGIIMVGYRFDIVIDLRYH